MYQAFNVQNLNIKDDPNYKNYLAEGRRLFSENKKAVTKNLDSYFNSDGTLEAKEIMGDWFPEVEADVFLSHSHKDENEIIALAGYLSDKLGLKVFIDSTVWGYSNELLLMFDKEHCFNKETNTYSYESRNISTTHIHLMLSIALMSMLDKTEAVFFYDTPNSVSLSNDIEKATNSPWIFSEISMTRMVRTRSRDEHRGIVLKASMESGRPIVESMPSVSYPLVLGHLIDLNNQDFQKWVLKAENKKEKGQSALDLLYSQVGV